MIRPTCEALVWGVLLSIAASLSVAPGGYAAGVDPVTVGAWEIAMNGGQWMWEIFPDGTYKFHSEAPDGVAPHAGRFSASGGSWSLRATNGYTDGGTYNFQPPGNFVVTGHLGTGAWHHPSSAANDTGSTRNPPPPNPGPVFDGHGGMFNCNPCNGPMQK